LLFCGGFQLNFWIVIFLHLAVLPVGFLEHIVSQGFWQQFLAGRDK